ncbi:MAG: PAS domain S-box protein [Phycisphaerae bacterium]
MLDCFGIFTAMRDEAGRITDFRIDYLNAAACENNRLPLEAQLGRRLCDLLPGHRESGLFDAYCRLVETGEHLELEQVHYADDYGEPADDETAGDETAGGSAAGGQPAGGSGRQRLARAFDIRAVKLDDGFAACWRDITHRKQAEAAGGAVLRQAWLATESAVRLPTLTSGFGRDETSDSETSDAGTSDAGPTQAEAPQAESGKVGAAYAGALHESAGREPAEPVLASGEPAVSVAVADEMARRLANLHEELNRQGRLLTALLDHIPVLLCIWDSRLRVFRFNQKMVQTLGWTEADANAGDFMAKVYPDPAYRTEVVAYMQSHRPAWRDFRTTARDGHEVLIAWTNVRLSDETSVGIGVDLRDREEAQRALAKSEQRLRLALEAGEMGAWEVAESDDFGVIDAGMARLFGLPAGVTRLPHAMFFELVHPDDHQRVTDAIAEAWDRSGHFNCEWRCMVQGRERWIVAAGRVFDEPEGRRMLGVNYDVTPARLAAEGLRQSESRLRKLFSSIDEGYCLCEMVLDEAGRPVDYRFLEANRLFEEFTGITDAVGKTAYEAIPGLEPHWLQTYARAALGGETLRFEQWAEPLGKWFDVYASPAGGERQFVIVFRDVTEHKLARQQLERNAETFYRLVANNPFGMLVVDADFKLLHLSAGAHQAFSNMPATVGQDFGDVMRHIWSEPFASEAIGRYRHTLETGEPFHCETSVETRRDRGSLEAYDWRTERITLPDGRFGVVGYFYDLSERQAWEGKVRASEERTRSILDSIADGLITVDADWTVKYLNPRAEEVVRPLHAGSAAVVGRNLWDVFPGLLGTEFEVVYRRVMASGQPGSIEALFEPLGRWFDVRAYPYHGGISFYFLDVTERREAEGRVKDANERLRLAGDAAGLGIYDFDILSGRITWDERVRQLWGVGPDDPVDLDVFYAGLHPDDISPTQAALEESTDPAGDGAFAAEYRVISQADGLTRWVAATGRTTFEQGKPVRLIGVVQDVTERHEVAEELARSSAQSATILNQMTEGLALFDMDGNLVLMNPAALALHGFESVGDAGQTIDELPDLFRVSELDGKILTSDQWPISRAVAGETVRNMELRVRRIDDGRTWIGSYSGTPVRGADGRAIGAILTMRDVTAERQAEARLAEQAQRLRLALMGGEMGLWDLDISANRVVWNARQQQLWGVHVGGDDASFDVRVVFEQLHPDDRDRVYTECMDAAHGKTPMFRSEFRVVHPDGQVRWLVGLGTPVGGTPDAPERLIGVNYDITNRKTAEEQLRQSELHFRNLADTAPAILWITDEKGQCTYISRSWSDYTGQPPEASRDLGWTRMIHPDDQAAVAQKFVDANSEGDAFRMAYRVRTVDGGYRWALDVGHPRFDEQGKYQGMIGSVIDIHDRVEAEDAMRRAKEEAEEANRAKDRFLAVLSHELRTPLSPVLMAVSNLAEDPELADEHRETMAMVRRNVAVEARLIDDLLDISRVLNGKLRLDASPLKLHSVIKYAVETVTPDAQAKGITVSTLLRAKEDDVVGDAGRLQQVLCNLLNNAVKFTPPDGSILVLSKQTGRQITITVMDTGVGIEESMLEKIFDAFEQGNEHVTRTFGGMGLGLAVCKGIVEAHLGSISAESDGEGRGATFIVKLPLSRSPKAGVKANAGFGGVAGRTADGKPHRLLLVEDHIDTARVLGQILRQQGYEVTVAHSVAEAIAAVDEARTTTDGRPDDQAAPRPFDLLLSDLGLPDGTGYDVMAAVRDAGLVGIAMSGFGMEADLERSEAAGFSEHLVKPVDVAQLQAVIRRLVT